MPKYYIVPFGDSGTRSSVPNGTQMDGTVNYTDGYGPDYSLPLDSDPNALALERDKWNQIVYDITYNIQSWQQFGVPAYITSSDNGGSPYPYAVGALVRYGGVNYISKSAANTELPTNAAHWAVFDGINITGNAATATALQNARTIGGVSFNGTANIVPETILPASEASDTTCYVTVINAATATAQQLKYNSGLIYNASINALTATTFIGALTGNASTATALATARTIGAVSFDGTANIVPQTIQTVDESADTTCFPLFANTSGTQTGGQQAKTNSGLTYNSTTNTLSATNLGGTLTTPAQGNITSVGTLTGGATSTGFTVNLTNSTVVGVLTGVNGGTNNAFMQFSGPTTSTKTYTLPNASCTILTDNAVVTVPQGGTGLVSTTAYGVICAGTTATGALQNAGTGAVNQVLYSAGSSAVPEWKYEFMPQNSRSADYTLALSDSGASIYHPTSDTTARVWTIPANDTVAFPIGATVTFINDTGAGVVTISINTDTLILAGTGSTGSRTLSANGVATATKVTSTRWIISGTGLT